MARTPRTAAQVAAQVAVEAVANDPAAYDEDTKLAVLSNGEQAGVAAFYLDMLRTPEAPCGNHVEVPGHTCPSCGY